MAQFNIFRSTDANAPTLNGQSGSLVNVFDYCLVTGSGWLRPYSASLSGANDTRVVYQIPTGSMFYMNLQDNATGSGGAKEARVWAYEVAVGQDTGSAQRFPSGSQGVGVPGYLIIRKSLSADTLRREWIAFADSRSFYFFSATGDTANTYYTFHFGDYYSISASTDPYSCVICARSVENNPAEGNGLCLLSNTLTAGTAGNYTPRPYTGLTTPTGSSYLVGKSAIYGLAGGSGFFYGNTVYPNPIDNSLWLAPIFLYDWSSFSVIQMRGRMRGLWTPNHKYTYFSNGQIITGSNAYQGKTFMVVGPERNNKGMFFMEISNTLETN